MPDAAAEGHFLQTFVIVLATAVVVVSLMRHIRISPVLGYLIAGTIVGPAGIGLIEDTQSVRILADLGVAVLLFTIGLDLSLARLRAMRWHVFGLGGLQVLLCGAVIGGMAVTLGTSGTDAFIIGAALALSSTAMVIALMREQGTLATQSGRVALAILLFQDLLVVPLLVLIPQLGGDGETVLLALAFAFLKGVLALIGIILLGRIVLAPLFRSIAGQRNADLLVGLTLLVVLGASWATESVGLSLALGAFLAGVLLAETEFRHQVDADIQPFRGILVGLFFMTVGMSMNLELLVSEWPVIFATVIALMVVKAIIIAGLCRAFGFNLGVAIKQGLLLSQSGEFAFVLLALSIGLGALSRPLGEGLMLVTALTIALTPLAGALGARLAAALRPERLSGTDQLRHEAADIDEHVIVCAFGRVGQIVAQCLAARDLPYLAVDVDSDLIAAARAKGLPAYFGDASNPNVLRAAGVERARAVIITMDSHEATLRAVATLRRVYPDLPILARARDAAHCDALKAAGVTVAVLEAVESGLLLGGAMLRALGADEAEIVSAIAKFRDNDYAGLAEIVVAKPSTASGAGRSGSR